jgi:hypothetical protein
VQEYFPGSGDFWMRRSHLSLVTAVIAFFGTLLWLALGRPVAALFWTLIGIGWLVTAIVQLRKSDTFEPFPGRRLLRRFFRRMIWS